MVSWPTHTRIGEEDYNSKAVLEGIPTNFPIEGPMSHMLEILSTSLNFTYKQVVPPDKSWGVRADNGTWSGMMRQVVQKEVNLALGPFTVISSRYEDSDMSIPFFFDKLAMLVGRGSAAIDPWSFAMPFTPVLWGILLVIMMGICLFHMLLESSYLPRTNRLRLFGGILFEYMQPPLEIGN
ncbi:probable glutamate receptor [Macrobrachium rosenbergii]|uniref:probable glutamate receptor n=1 Tax=Macrobrachium rosenbergii TaxID=79674 RepID=UPI0034D76363